MRVRRVGAERGDALADLGGKGLLLRGLRLLLLRQELAHRGQLAGKRRRIKSCCVCSGECCAPDQLGIQRADVDAVALDELR